MHRVPRKAPLNFSDTMAPVSLPGPDTMLTLKFRLIVLTMHLLAALPWSWLRALGNFLGWIFWRFDTREKRVTATNIALCLPELDSAARTALTRARLAEFGRTVFEMPKLWLSPSAVVEAQIREIEGEGLMLQQLGQRRGVMLLAPHHGNWEVAGIYLAEHYGITIMYLPSQSAEIEALVRNARSRNGAKLVPADASGVRSVYKTLKQGGLVGVLPDQVPNQGADFAPFFGRPALTMTLVSNLLQKTHARAIMCVALRLPSGGFKLVFTEADAALYSNDLQQSLSGLNRSVEAVVRVAPDQYQWEYKRFKRQPQGVPAVYD